MKIALINDVHLGVKNDAQYMLDYQKKFFDEIFFPYLKRNDIDTVLMGGDLFDRRKYINFRTLSETRKFLFDILKKENITMHCIPGNHCVYFKSTNDVNSIELLLSEYKNIIYYHKPTTLTFGDVSIDMVPWINNENYQESVDFIKSTTSKILYGHLELAGYEMHAGVKNQHGMSDSLFKEFDEVWSGHFHQKSQQRNIKYLGAPMEFTFADCDCERGFHVYDTETNTLEFIKNPFNLFEKIYYNDEEKTDQDFFRNVDTARYANKHIKLFAVKKTKPAIYEHFVDRLYGEDTHSITIHEDYSEFHETNVDIDMQDQSTKDLMHDYVEKLETDMNKDRIVGILDELYIEAMNE